MTQPPEQTLWQAVLFNAVIDATATKPTRKSYEVLSRAAARKWIAEARRDFQCVCILAGLDHDFIHEAYMSGKIDREALKAASKAAA